MYLGVLWLGEQLTPSNVLVELGTYPQESRLMFIIVHSFSHKTLTLVKVFHVLQEGVRVGSTITYIK